MPDRGRNRVNTAFMVWTFCGQLVGTSVGSRLYERGGWIASGSYSVGSIGAALMFALLRGPWENRWIGWHGGCSIVKKSKNTADGRTVEIRSHLMGREVNEERVEGAEVEDTLVHDLHENHHGHDDQGAVIATDAEKSLEMMAAEDRGDENSDEIIVDDSQSEGKHTVTKPADQSP